MKLVFSPTVELNSMGSRSVTQLEIAMGQITDCLNRISEGQQEGVDLLYSLTYDTLRQLAGRHIARESKRPYQPTELVHEVWLRLGGSKKIRWQSQQHFFFAASEAMRRILIDAARKRNRLKRSGQLEKSEIDDEILAIDPFGLETIALNEALEAFEAHSPTKAKVVRLKFFFNMTIEEIASVMEISTSTVERHWAYAKAWLYDEIESDNHPSQATASTPNSVPNRESSKK